jgi:hypothetical protein
MDVVILGAGLSGTIAAGALSSFSPRIFEAKKKSKSGIAGHHAVMRMRNPDIAKYIGMPTKKICVRKEAVWGGKSYDRCTIRMNNLYSWKVYKNIETRSISQLGTVDRYLIEGDIAPPNAEYRCKAVNIEDNTVEIHQGDGRSKHVKFDVLISTIPLLSLLSIVYNREEIENVRHVFQSKPIHVAKTRVAIESKVHQTIYFPDTFELKNCYRATLEGQTLLIECINGWDSGDMDTILSYFGLNKDQVGPTEVYKQEHGKIKCVNDDIRRAVIMDLTDRFGIYSFGRFAVWRSLRADQLAEDIERIVNMAKASDITRKYKEKLNES